MLGQDCPLAATDAERAGRAPAMAAPGVVPCGHGAFPGTIHTDRMDENLTVRFRVGGVYTNCYISAYFDDERVIHKKRPVVEPGEMEEIKLTKEQLLKYPDLQTITVKIEEA